MMGYLLNRADIDAYAGIEKQHFLNEHGRRRNKSLGDLTGLKGLGFHLIEVEPGFDSTETHVHYFEEECVYVLAGTATATVGEETFEVEAGDFLGYRAGGLAHKLTATGSETLRCLVAGQRLAHDVADYPQKGKRLFRNGEEPWCLADIEQLESPVAGAKD
ncbi:MAG: cupin domain-containing protein [Pseudomonadota bacterium]